jgi:predicted nucleic acid-binding protein
MFHEETLPQEGAKTAHFCFKALDALHLACAEAAGATHFLTCDDRLIR